MSTDTKTEQKPRVVMLGQRRANHAWKCVQKAMGDFGSKEELKEYAREAKKLPIRISASGLGQALAFIHSKSKKSKASLSQLHRDLSQWVLIDRDMSWTPGDPDWQPPKDKDRPDLLLEAIVYGTSDFLRWSTDETLAYLQWLNRFLEANVDVEDTE